MSAVTDITAVARKRGFVRPVFVGNSLFGQAIADESCEDSEMIQTLRSAQLVDALLESMRRSSPRLSPFVFHINGNDFGVVPVSLPEGIVLVEGRIAERGDRA
ncbi:MAG TPA: hypothetical protein VMM36_04825 [Opitutaceae bacterium]|nr:hypothetical protein [Opitutaceae bacterium]